MTRLQFAIDTIDRSEALQLADNAVMGGVDILELGTPLLMRYGSGIISDFHAMFGDIPLYADAKVIDLPEPIIRPCLEFGASIVSVLLTASREVLIEASKIAYRYSKKIAYSSMGCPLRGLAQRAESIAEGSHYVIAHGSGPISTAFSQMLEQAGALSGLGNRKLIMAGGIEASNVEEVLRFSPDIIIVGRGISCSKDPRTEVSTIKSILGRD